MRFVLNRLGPFKIELKITRRRDEEASDVGYVEPVDNVASRRCPHGVDVCLFCVECFDVFVEETLNGADTPNMRGTSKYFQRG